MEETGRLKDVGRWVDWLSGRLADGLIDWIG